MFCRSLSCFSLTPWLPFANRASGWHAEYQVKAKRYLYRLSKDHIGDMMQWAFLYWGEMAATKRDIDNFYLNSLFKNWFRWMHETRRWNKINRQIDTKLGRINRTNRNNTFLWWKRRAWREIAHGQARLTSEGLYDRFLRRHGLVFIRFWRKTAAQQRRAKEEITKIKRNQIILTGKKFFSAIIQCSNRDRRMRLML